jgi:hypothetical protein
MVDHDHQDRHATKKIQLHVPMIAADLDVPGIVQKNSSNSMLSWNFEPEFRLWLVHF